MDVVLRIVREKEHLAEPATAEQALDEMELVGHDFYLFSRRLYRAAQRGVPTRDWGFGVIRLV